MEDKKVIEVLPIDLEIDESKSNNELALIALDAFISHEGDTTLTDTEKKLGPRRLRFVKEFINNGGKAEDAAKKAGYNPIAATSILGDKFVKLAIQERLGRRGVVQSIDRDWVLSKMARIAEMCSKEEASYDKRGNIIGTKVVDATNALKALKDIGTELGMFSNKIEMGGTDEPIKIERKEIIVDVNNIAQRLAASMIKGDENEL